MLAGRRFCADSLLTKQLCLLLRSVTLNAEVVNQVLLIVVLDGGDQNEDKKEMVKVGILQVLLDAFFCSGDKYFASADDLFVIFLGGGDGVGRSKVAGVLSNCSPVVHSLPPWSVQAVVDTELHKSRQTGRHCGESTTLSSEKHGSASQLSRPRYIGITCRTFCRFSSNVYTGATGNYTDCQTGKYLPE